MLQKLFIWTSLLLEALQSWLEHMHTTNNTFADLPLSLRSFFILLLNDSDHMKQLWIDPLRDIACSSYLFSDNHPFSVTPAFLPAIPKAIRWHICPCTERGHRGRFFFRIDDKDFSDRFPGIPGDGHSRCKDRRRQPPLSMSQDGCTPNNRTYGWCSGCAVSIR